MRKAWIALIAALWGLATPALAQAPAAQPAPAAAQADQGKPAGRQSGGQEGVLPQPATTAHVLELPGRTLRYHATAGALILRDSEGRSQAEIGYVAYTLDGGDAADRPITFAFNGGPGASSAYLHLGALGPKRLAFGNRGDGPSSPPILTDNRETWLDFTDLVFVDPVGTGYSRFIAGGDEVRRQLWSVGGDVEALARFVRQYLVEAGRVASPKFLVGESYGGFRVPKIAHALQVREGIGVAGLMMVSPVLDFASRQDESPLNRAALLPSLAAAALEAKGGAPVTRARLAEAERYAAGDYIVDLLRGPRDKAAVERIVAKVSELGGLDRDFVARRGGRLDARDVARELHRRKGEVGSYYDASIAGLDPDPYDARGRVDDPILIASIAPLTSAMIDYLRRDLNYRVDLPYEVLNQDLSRRWNWGSGNDPAEAVSDLRAALALDPKLRAVVVHGFTDLVTPYFSSQLVLNQLPTGLVEPDRVRLEVFPGGHMFYTRDDSRSAMRAAAAAIYPEAGKAVR